MSEVEIAHFTSYVFHCEEMPEFGRQFTPTDFWISRDGEMHIHGWRYGGEFCLRGVAAAARAERAES